MNPPNTITNQQLTARRGWIEFDIKPELLADLVRRLELYSCTYCDGPNPDRGTDNAGRQCCAGCWETGADGFRADNGMAG